MLSYVAEDACMNSNREACRLVLRHLAVMYKCMYLMIGKGQIAQKWPYWGENRLKSKIWDKYKHLVDFWKLVDPVPMLLQVVNDSSNLQLCMQSCSFFYGFSQFAEEV